MKKFRKLLFFAAITALLTCLLCVALNATQYSGNCGKDGNNVTWSLDTETGVLKIEGKGTMAKYSWNVNAPWYDYRDSIKTVSVLSGVSSIGDHAFRYCGKIESITMPESISSIGANAFRQCTSLTKLVIPSKVVQIGSNAIRGCTNLTNITLPSGLTSVGDYALEENPKLNYNEYDNAYYLGNSQNPYVVLVKAKDSSVESCEINSNTNIIYFSAFQNCTKLTGIRIHGNITLVGAYAFDGCTKLANVTFKGGTKTLQTMECIFQNCTSLTKITIPKNASYLYGATFAGCTSLEKVVLLSYATRLVDMENTISNTATIWGYSGSYAEAYATKYNRKFVSITASGTCGESLTWMLDEEGLLSIEGTGKMEDCPSWYSYRSSIKSVEIAEGVTSIGDSAFSSCSSLTSIIIPNSVTSIGDSAFSGCRSLTSIIIPYCVTSIGDSAFDGCSSLTSITIPNGVTSIGNSAFWGCRSLTSITIPNGVASIGNGMFYNCSSLVSITILSKDVTIYDSSFTISDTATIYGYSGSTAEAYATKYNRKFVAIIVSGTYGENLTWMLDEEGLLIIDGTGKMEDYSSDQSLWYYYRSRVKSVEIAEGVTSIGQLAFDSCSVLTSIEIPSSVTSIRNLAFARCSSLTSVIFDENSQLTSIGGQAFYGCSSLTSITIPSKVTSIGDRAFSSCSSLTDINVDEANENYKSINGVLFSKDEETLIKYPAGKSETAYIIPSKVTSIGDGAFSGCSSLTSITIPSSVTRIGNVVFSGCSKLTSIIFDENSQLTSIGSQAFYNCSSLTSITIPSKVTSIGQSAFSGCSSLTSITIPSKVTSIEQRMFSDCSSLVSITIPNGVTSIGEYAFCGCSSLTSITIFSKDVTICNSANTISKTATIYGYSGSTAEAYATKYNRKFVVLRNIIASGYCGAEGDGSNLTWALDDKGLLTIDGTGAMAGYSSGYTPWNNYNSGINSVEISDGVTTIGKNSIKYTNAVSISMPESITRIESAGFEGNEKLLSIVIPANVEYIGDYAFNNCTSLENITFEKNSKLTEISSAAFGYCIKLCSLEIPASVTSIATSSSGFVYGNYSMTSLTVADGNTVYHSKNNCIIETATKSLIAGCKTSTIPTDGSVVVIESGAFDRSNISSIVIPESVTDIKMWTFGSCNSLQKITILNKNANIANDVYAIYAGATIVGHSGSTAEAYATKYNRKFVVLRNIIASGTCGKTLTWALDEDGLLTIEGSGAMEDYSVGQSPWNSYRSKVKSVEIGNGVTSIGEYAFYGCSSLTSITIPNSVTSIGRYAFSVCSSLASIEIPDSIASIGMHAFIYCGSLTSITIPSGVTSIGNGAFANCSSLIYNEYDNAKYLGNSENPYVALIEAKSTSIVSCTINHRTKTIAGGAFWGCTNLTSITIPDSITSIGSNAFYNCSKLTSIEIPSGVTTIGQAAFFGCSSLMSITIPSNVTNIEDGVFQNCSKLTSIDIPNSVTSIGGGAFCGCNGLTSISIPSSVTIIWQGAFLECSNLTSVSIFSKNVTIVDDAAAITPDTATIYGYSGSTAEAYATKYNRKFVAIDKYNSMNANATLNENITMNFIGTALTKEDVDGNDFKMTFVMNGSKTSVSPVEKNGKYTFPFAGIAPQCMNDEINYEMTMNGAVVKQGSISVSGYLKQLIEKGRGNMTDAKFKALSTLVSDMLNYGSAAQAYTGHGTDSLLNKDYYNDIVNKYTELESTDKALSGAAPAGAKFTNVGVRFDNVNKVFFRFTADNISNVIITINGVVYEQDKFVKTGDKYTVYSEDVLASKFDTVYTAILTYRGLDEQQMMKYSVKSFAYSFQNKRGEDGKLTAEAVLARATYTYGVSAKAYENAE